MESIDESWRADRLKGPFAFDDAEFQIALTLAVQGHKVTSRNDQQPGAAPEHKGDAWVDGKRTDFKAMKSLRTDGLRDHLKKADRDQQVEMAVVDLRPGGMEEDDAEDGFDQFARSNTNIRKVVIYGRNYMLEYNL